MLLLFFFLKTGGWGRRGVQRGPGRSPVSRGPAVGRVPGGPAVGRVPHEGLCVWGEGGGGTIHTEHETK